MSQVTQQDENGSWAWNPGRVQPAPAVCQALCEVLQPSEEEAGP